MLFGLIDRTITVLTISETFYENRYDTNVQYDTDVRYDTSICTSCPTYSIEITTDGTTRPTQYIASCAKSIILFNQPIDVKLKSVRYNTYDIDDTQEVAPPINRVPIEHNPNDQNIDESL